MKQIQLTQGQSALVDNGDYKSLSRHKWYAHRTRSGEFYAMRKQKQEPVYMSREILRLGRGRLLQVDHRNHNKLDNRKSNLRLCTYSQQQHNRLPCKNMTSIYKGVCWNKGVKKWMAQIKLNMKVHYIGCFVVEKDAARAYDNKAKELHGEFAYLNSKHFTGLLLKAIPCVTY